MELQLSSLPDKSVHVPRLSGENFVVLEVNEMIVVESVFRLRQFVRLHEPYVPVMLLYPGLYGLTSLSDVHLTTLAGYALNTRSF